MISCSASSPSAKVSGPRTGAGLLRTYSLRLSTWKLTEKHQKFSKRRRIIPSKVEHFKICLQQVERNHELESLHFYGLRGWALSPYVKPWGPPAPYFKNNSNPFGAYNAPHKVLRWAVCAILDVLVYLIVFPSSCKCAALLCTRTLWSLSILLVPTGSSIHVAQDHWHRL